MTQRAREAKTVVEQNVWRRCGAVCLVVLAAPFAVACGNPKPAPPPSLVADPPPTDDGRAPGAGQTRGRRAGRGGGKAGPTLGLEWGKWSG